MFINTKIEAKIAVGLAHEYGFSVLTEANFLKRYVVNVFSVWASHNDAREAQSRINEAIRADRLSRRRPAPAELSSETREEREKAAHNISARTGEPYNDVLKRLG